MAKGIVYLLTSKVPGVVKIGRTASDNFEARMMTLESNGFSNVTGLSRCFAIETTDYAEKEDFLHHVFAYCRCGTSEFFAVDSNLVIQLMSSFEGKQIYPKDETKKQVFQQANTIRSFEVLRDDTDYILEVHQKGNGTIKATLTKKDGQYFIKKGSRISARPYTNKLIKGWAEVRKTAKIKNGFLQEDLLCSSPSMASSIVLSYQSDGWENWKTEDGILIDAFRQIQKTKNLDE